MIITQTPFRISLFGGGSDFPAWFSKNEGKVVSLTIDKYCYITARILPPFFGHRFRIAYSKVEAVSTYEEIQHPVVREAIRMFAPDLSLEIHHDGDLPARSGVGSSSAFAIGMIHSILALKNIQPTNFELANYAIQIEQEILKENVGWQDQIACAYGGVNAIDFGPGDNWSVSNLNLSQDYLQELTSRMVLVYTGIQRKSSDISAGLVSNMNRSQTSLRLIKEMADTCARILTSAGELDQIGFMLNSGWKLKKEINPSATTEALDNWYMRAMKAGALGGKILGAGGGGFFLFWVAKGGREDFLTKLGHVTEVPVKISPGGTKLLYKSPSQTVAR